MPTLQSDHEEDVISAGSLSDYEPEYEVEKVGVAGLEFEVMCVVPPPLEFMSALHTKQQEISGRQVWTGSLFLANVLVGLHQEMALSFDKKRVLELGSGTGILGMTLSKISHPLCLLLTDGDQKAVELLQMNLRNSNNGIESTVVQARLFRWGSTGLGATCVHLWPCLWPSKQDVLFDFILAGDVLYKADLPALFFSTVTTYLSSQGVLFLCHVPRANVTHEIVQQAAKDAGMKVECLPTQGINVDGCPIEDASQARIYRMTRSPSDINVII